MIRVELPVSDAELQDMGLAVQELCQSMRELYLALMEQAIVQALTAPEWVATIVLARVTEALESIELLLGFGRARDAAILILAILELLYDVRYVRLDHSRASLWLSHSRKGQKPWRVAHLQREIYTVPADLEAAKVVYQQLSMLKHGNPASGVFGFPLAKNGRTIEYRFEQEHHALAAFWLMAGTLGGEIAEQTFGCFSKSNPPSLALLTRIQTISSNNTRLFEKKITALFSGEA